MKILKFCVAIFSCISLCYAQDTDVVSANNQTTKKSESMRKWGSYGSVYLMTQSITETPSTGGSISSFNVSPISLSLTNSYRLAKDSQLLWTGYYTHYLQTKVETDNGTENINYPGEYGFNFYYRQTLPKYRLVSLFAGVDFESFSFFDTPAFTLDNTNLIFNRYNLYFASLGISDSFVVKKNIINIKGMLSHTISSSTSIYPDDKVTGMKYQLSFSLRPGIDSYLFYNAFVTHYQLSHFSDSSITRVGLGLSYFIQ